MTIVLLWVAWSVTGRVPDIAADTQALITEIADIEHEFGLSRAAARAEHADEVDTLQEMIGTAHEEAAGLRNRIDGMEQERLKQAGRLRDLEREELEHRDAVMRHEAELRELLGHEIVIHPGPPVRYDAGSEPIAPWYYGPIPSLVSRTFREKWIAWRAAEVACERANSFEATTGIELVEVRARVDQINAGIAAFRSRLDDIDAQIADFRQGLRRYTAAPWELLEDLDAKRRQVARTRWMRLFFWVFDIPTLCSCAATTVVAWARVSLIRGAFGPRQLSRSA